MPALILHGYWRSSAAYRVRIALNLKGLPYSQQTHDLRTGAQRAADYLELDPQGLVPALQVGSKVFIQSSAILEWLEERHPAPPLLPADVDARAWVRGMAALIACDIHPLHNLRVLGALQDDFGAAQPAVEGWVRRWIAEGFSALEQLVARFGGDFAFGDAPTMADCCLAPQVYSARRFALDMAPYPHLRRVHDRAAELEALVAAHPSRQPDGDPA